MARKRHGQHGRRTRFASAKSNRVRTLRPNSVRRAVPVSLSIRPLSPLRLYEDRRTFYPDALVRPVAAFVRSARRVVVNPIGPLHAPLRFADPRRVVVCVRRQVRREVLHALGVAGGRVRRGRRNELSAFSCR